MSNTEPVLALTDTLMRAVSVTPDDAGCQPLLADRLQACGFATEYLNAEDVTNLWASCTYGDPGGPHLIFAGHTDVVPTGPRSDWQSDPFQPEQRHGLLYGRGAADMKASLAAMVIAAERLSSRDDLQGTLSFLLTSDEEGPALHGTRYVVDLLAARGLRPDFCVVGEPSSSDQLGDVVRVGRRGSLNGKLVIEGIQGHVAYPDDADNPIHASLAVLAELSARTWDNGNEYYPPTSFQISNMQSGTGATNVIPGHLELLFNFRFNTEQTATGLQEQVTQALDAAGLKYSLDWQLSGAPFLTERGRLTEAVITAIDRHCGLTPELSTSGGTSDGRFIAPWDGEHRVEVVELGPLNATIHKIDECVPVQDLPVLADLYHDIAKYLLRRA